MDGHGWSFPITGLTFQVRKVMCGGWVACRIKVSVPVPVPFLWTLDFGFGTWIWDLDLGPGFGTGLGLDNYIAHRESTCRNTHVLVTFQNNRALRTLLIMKRYS